MELICCSVEGKPFQILLLNITKRLFYGEDTTQAIESIYSSLGIEDQKMKSEVSSIEDVSTILMVILMVIFLGFKLCRKR